MDLTEKWFVEFHSITNLCDKIDFIYTSIDKFLRDDKFWLINILLDKLDCSKLSIVENLAFLSITFTAKENLDYREKFYFKVKTYLISIGESQEKIDELLRGLN